MAILKELADDYSRATALVNLLIDHSTGGSASEGDFLDLRRHFIEHPHWSSLLPKWFVSLRSLNQFWQMIKNRHSTYAARRTYLWDEFNPLLMRLESGSISPAEDDIESGLSAFNSEEVSRSWRRMVHRISNDPEGAITASRNLLETVLKHILDNKNIPYDTSRIELPDLFKSVQTALGLAPEQHQEQVFKQILGGCAGIVNGLGTMRNKLGDAHGAGVGRVRPSARHARLAVNLAGSMSLFLVETFTAKSASQQTQPS